MPRVKINVSGVMSEFDSEILEHYPSHKLHILCKEVETAKDSLEITVNRSPDCFNAILVYYQTGELHMPSNICPSAFKQELHFWNVPDTDLKRCCYYRYHSFHETMETEDRFRAYKIFFEYEDMWPPSDGRISKLGQCRRRLWGIVDYREDSLTAKLYLAWILVLVMIGIFTLALSTEPSFQRSLSNCEMLEYLEYFKHESFQNAYNSFGEPSCKFLKDPAQGNSPPSGQSGGIESGGSTKPPKKPSSPPNSLTTNAPVELPDIYLPHDGIRYTEISISVLFTIDLMLRMFSCPCIKKYFKSFVNVIDILALVSFYAHELLIQFRRGDKYTDGWVRTINYIQIVRAFRLFRFAKNVRASLVLTYTLRQNIKDMSLLVLLLIIGTSISANVMYFVDRANIRSIPEAWYWSIITLTTVGYGDITPGTTGAKIVASVLAVCGVLLLSVTLPMFVNNFLTLYQYSCLEETVAAKKNIDKDSRKLDNAGLDVKLEKYKPFINDCQGKLIKNGFNRMDSHTTIPGQIIVSTPILTRKNNDLT